jgi:hypothetical protein
VGRFRHDHARHVLGNLQHHLFDQCSSAGSAADREYRHGQLPVLLEGVAVVVRVASERAIYPQAE